MASSEERLFGLKCKVLSDELKAQMGDLQCADKHCWGSPEFVLTLLAGAGEDSLHVNIPICERHGRVLGHVVEGLREAEE
jgi:hypothetical protein